MTAKLLNWKLLGILVLCLYTGGGLGLEARVQSKVMGGGQGEKRVTTKKEGGSLDA